MHLGRLGIVILTTATLTVACGGVDRGGSRDDIIEAMRDQGLDPDADCVASVLAGFSDDDLKGIDDQLGEPASTDPQTQQFLEALRACATPVTAPSPTTTAAP